MLVERHCVLTRYFSLAIFDKGRCIRVPVRMLYLRLLNQDCILIEFICLESHVNRQFAFLAVVTEQARTFVVGRHSMLRHRSLCIIGLIRNLKVDILVLVGANGRRALLLASGNGREITFTLILSAEGRAHTLVIVLMVYALRREGTNVLHVVRSRAAVRLPRLPAACFDLKVQVVVLVVILLNYLIVVFLLGAFILFVCLYCLAIWVSPLILSRAARLQPIIIVLTVHDLFLFVMLFLLVQSPCLSLSLGQNVFGYSVFICEWCKQTNMKNYFYYMLNILGRYFNISFNPMCLSADSWLIFIFLGFSNVLSI